MLNKLELRTNSYPLRARVLKIVGALLAVALFVGVSATLFNNVVATPVSPRELEMRGWVNELRDANLTANRQQAQQKLEAAGAEAVPVLLTALHANDATLRQNAADMLGFIASPDATNALVATLNTDAVPAVRANSAWALGEIKSPAAFGVLARASVLDGSPQVRQNAVDALASVQDNLARLAGKDPASVNAIAVAPGQTNTIYMASGRDLLVSRNAGAAWETRAQTLPSLASALEVNPTNPEIVYAGMHSQGMYLSTDGGSTWQSLTRNFSNEAIGESTVTAIAVDAANPLQVVMAHGIRIGDMGSQFFPLGILTSRDGGQTWDYALDLSEGQIVTRLAVQNNKIYALAGDKVLITAMP